MVLVSGNRLWCGNDPAEGEPVAVAALDAVQADVLGLRPRDDLVARRRLPRQPQLPILPRPVIDCLGHGPAVLACGGGVVPFRRSPSFRSTNMFATPWRLIW